VRLQNSVTQTDRVMVDVLGQSACRDSATDCAPRFANASRPSVPNVQGSYGVLAIAAVCWHCLKLFFTEATGNSSMPLLALLFSRNCDAFTGCDRFAGQLIRLLAIVGSKRLAVVGHAPGGQSRRLPHSPCSSRHKVIA